jgi:hypothetical protein
MAVLFCNLRLAMAPTVSAVFVHSHNGCRLSVEARAQNTCLCASLQHPFLYPQCMAVALHCVAAAVRHLLHPSIPLQQLPAAGSSVFSLRPVPSRYRCCASPWGAVAQPVLLCALPGAAFSAGTSDECRCLLLLLSAFIGATLPPRCKCCRMLETAAAAVKSW